MSRPSKLIRNGFPGGLGAMDLVGGIVYEREPKTGLAYVDNAYYTGTVFHRVIEGFVVQGGGYNRDFRNKNLMNPVPNESKNGLANDRGTLSAARTADPHSATSQFYVNLDNNTSLNARGDEWGYTVFGQITEGMSVIDNIAALPTGAAGPSRAK